MQVIDDQSWWWGFAWGWRWWLAIASLGVAAWPLTLRFFRGLADRGASAAPIVGVAVTVAMLWSLSLEWFTGDGRAAMARAAMAVAAAAISLIAAWTALRYRVTHQRPAPAPLRWRWRAAALLPAFLALVHVPFNGAAFWVAAALTVVASALAWAGELPLLRRRLRETLAPFLAGQLLFLAGFVVFANIRSYIPWITWDTTSYASSGAEKFGNFMHLNSLMMARTMPPGDAWFLGEPDNYYYGGHAAVAALAKATATSSPVAFNCGLAALFGLTLCGGFCLVFNLCHAFPRRARWGRWLHTRGLAWGVAGALAIAAFGTFDAWQQFLAGNPADTLWDAQSRVSGELRRDGMKPNEAEARARQLLARPGALRWGRENLERVNFWNSSRAFHSAPPGILEPGTITEFPAFSALLGDLHPHHMAVPVSLLVACAALSLLRKSARFRGGDAAWWARCWPELAAMGAAIGWCFPVNIWDAVVNAPLILSTILVARLGASSGERWAPVAFAGAAVALFAAVSVLLGARQGAFPLFANGAAAVAGLAVVLAAAAIGTTASFREHRGRLLALAAAIAFVLVFAGGWVSAADEARRLAAVAAANPEDAAQPAPGPLRIALRDAGVLMAVLASAGLWSLRRPSPARMWWAASGAYYALCGGIALLVIIPFKAFFSSPLSPADRLMESIIPPRLSPTLLAASPHDFLAEFWRRSPVNPFPAELRTALGDYITHWGIFLIPLAAFLLVRLVRWASSTGEGRGPAFFGAALAALLLLRNGMASWTGPLAIVLTGACGLLAWARSRHWDGPVWVFAGVAFFQHAFVEWLHFDDDYAGHLERYNTPFKIIYPTWAWMAAGAVAALKALNDRLTCGGRREGAAAIPARLAVAAFLAAGMLYPIAATAMRTNSLHTTGISREARALGAEAAAQRRFAVRTLDGLAWMRDDYETRDDAAAIAWLHANARPGQRLLEFPNAHGYSVGGRIAAATGLPTAIGWSHHEGQWRGRARTADPALMLPLARFFNVDELALRGIAGEFFPEGADLRVARTLKMVATGPAKGMHSRAVAAFPELAPEEAHRLADRIIADRAGRLDMSAVTARVTSLAEHVYRSPVLDGDARAFLELHRPDYLVIGEYERRSVGADTAGLAKFSAWPVAFTSGGTTIHRVPAEFRAAKAAAP